jgi:hypothetical protein
MDWTEAWMSSTGRRVRVVRDNQTVHVGAVVGVDPRLPIVRIDIGDGAIVHSHPRWVWPVEHE